MRLPAPHLPFFLLPVFLAASAEASPPTCVTIRRGLLGDVADATIASHKPHRNRGDAPHLLGAAGPGAARALVRFDLSSLPEGVDIESAAVTLDPAGRNGAGAVDVHRITSGWDEDTVTWASFAGAFDPSPVASSDGGLCGTGPVALDLTSLTQAWVDGALPNHGVLLEPSSTGPARLWSSEASLAKHRPALSVCYRPCPGAEHLFSRRFGDLREQIGYSVAVDGAGDVVLAGSAAGAVDFGGGPVTPAGAASAFVAKFDAEGSLLWSRRFGSVDSFASAVAVDGEGNILLAGGFRDPIDLGGGPLTIPPDASLLTFVAKLDPDGNHLWSRSATGNERHFPRGIAADEGGNVVVAGSFEGFLDFTGGSSPLVSAGGLFDEDVFVSKFDASGNHLWSEGFGTVNIDRGEGIAVDSAGDIVLTGFFIDAGLGGLDLGGGPLPSAGSSEAFVAKLDPDGHHVWSRSYGDPGSQDAAAVAVDPWDNVLVTGSFHGSVDLGGGPLDSAGDNDVFVLKLDPWGGHVWSRRFGDALRQDGAAIAADAAGNVAISGAFQGALDVVCAPLESAGEMDVFVARLDADGRPLSSDRFGDEESQTPTDVAFGPGGDVVLTGYFDGTLDFGGGPLVEQGGRDAFLAKLGL
ncbi:DNRLRE domain-containing protein [Sorangium sp. So ce1128]